MGAFNHTFMRALQFWILILASTLISGLMIKQILLSRALYFEQRTLADDEQTAATAAGFENAWKQLALQIYQGSAQDADLAEVLRKSNVAVRANPAANAATPPATTPAGPPKPPVAPPSPPAH